MKREWSFWTTESKRDRHSKVHTKTHISCWCRTTLETSTVLRTWPEESSEASLKWTTSHQRMVASRCLHSTRRILRDQLCPKEIIEGRILTPAPRITRRIVSSTIRKTQKLAREESNITSFILILRREPSRWCVSNTNQLLWWDSIKTSRPSRCNIWVTPALICTKVTTEINGRMIQAWCHNKKTKKCMLRTQIFHRKVHQKAQGSWNHSSQIMAVNKWTMRQNLSRMA